MRMAYKQLAKCGNNFKDGLHKPTFCEDSVHAPMEADNFKDGLHKPTFHKDGLHAPMEAGNFKVGLHKPTFREMTYMQLAKFGAIQGWSSKAHLP